MNPVIFKHCDGKRNKIHYPKSVNYDKQSAIWARYNILLQFKSAFYWRSLMVTMRNMRSEKGRKI